jgi:hypothetical protein
MGDGTKLAIAILVFWLALVFFFFAFHPGGVKDVSNPGQMLKWLVDEFGNLAGGTAETKAALTADVTGNDALSYPGYTSQGSSDVGSVGGGGIQVA